MKNKIYIILLLIATTMSCKKYEDGPLISLRSPKNRLKGEWHVVKYTNNGVDSTKKKLSNTSFYYTMTFTYEKDEAISCISETYKGISNYNDWAESLENNKNKYFQFKYSAYGESSYNKKGMVSFPPFDSTSKIITSKWKILRLTNKEMKIRFIDSKDNETNIIIEYEKI